jgi:hypothetical protein
LADGTARLSFFIPGPGSGEGEGIFDWAVREGLKILLMNRRTLSLEDIFVHLTAGEASSSGGAPSAEDKDETEAANE